MDRNEGFHKLLVYQKSDELTLKIYEVTRSFPKEEIFGLISQMRRAAVSVPSNIVEGYTRKSKNDKLHFYNIAQGSLMELEYQLELSQKLGYISEADFNKIIDRKDEVGRLLYGFIDKSK